MLSGKLQPFPQRRTDIKQPEHLPATRLVLLAWLAPTLHHSGEGQRPDLSLCTVLCLVTRFPELQVESLLTKP